MAVIDWVAVGTPIVAMVGMFGMMLKVLGSLNKRFDDMNKRIDDLAASLNKRIDDLAAEVKDMHQEVRPIDKRMVHLEGRMDSLERYQSRDPGAMRPVPVSGVERPLTQPPPWQQEEAETGAAAR